MKPYQTIPITECGEVLVTIPADAVLFTDPPPYVALGASYDGASPWQLREGALQALLRAQAALTRLHAGWRLKLFDAYRPNTVQVFMVEREFTLVSGGRRPEELAESDRTLCWEKVYGLWAVPSDDPATPPPHSTGAAVDLTLADADGRDVWMGSPIDENSDRSTPDYFASLDSAAHSNRQLLLDVMMQAGFVRHGGEWWHFSLGDQMWAWRTRQQDPDSQVVARYGRADLLWTP